MKTQNSTIQKLIETTVDEILSKLPLEAQAKYLANRLGKLIEEPNKELIEPRQQFRAQPIEKKSSLASKLITFVKTNPGTTADKIAHSLYPNHKLDVSVPRVRALIYSTSAREKITTKRGQRGKYYLK